MLKYSSALATAVIYPPPLARSSSSGATPITTGGSQFITQSNASYILQADVDLLYVTGSYVKLFCNGFNARRVQIGASNLSSAGLEIYDLKLSNPEDGGIASLYVYGNNLATKSAVPAVIMDGANVLTDKFFSNAAVVGSNITIQNTRFERAMDGGNLIDDNVVSWAPAVNPAYTGISGVANPLRFQAYLTFQNVYFGSNYDKGCEGVGGWDNCNFLDCTSLTGIGGWYGWDWPQPNTAHFTMTNTNFINTITHSIFEFIDAGNGCDQRQRF